jgi:serine/threonine-protein kinase
MEVREESRDKFLRQMAVDYDLQKTATKVFLKRFAYENGDKGDREIAAELEISIETGNFGKQMTAIYKAFARVPDGCPGLEPENRDGSPFNVFFPWLWKTKFPEYLKTYGYEGSAADATSELASEPGWRSRFQALIEDKTKDFVGREYVFDAIADFLTNQPNGYFIIEGDPGMGKSAILAEYVQQTGCVAHFNVQGEYETVEEFLKTVRTELIDRYQLTPPPIPADTKQYGAFLNELLAETAQKRNGERVVIAIDALDEVDSASHPTNGNILYLPRYLHEGIYFVMTRRRGVEIPFITDAPQQLFKLMDYQNQSRDDARTYIQNQVNGSEQLRQRIREREETETEFIDKITDKSENNFMYLVYVLRDIEQGLYQDLSLERFPQGLQQYYEFHWRHMGMTAKPLSVTKINIVYHLAESHQPISPQLISEYIGEPQLTVQEVLDEWQQFLHKQPIEGEICYNLYHASFRDFLHRQDIVRAAGVSLKAIKKQKTDTLWEAMFGDE